MPPPSAVWLDTCELDGLPELAWRAALDDDAIDAATLDWPHLGDRDLVGGFCSLEDQRVPSKRRAA